MRQFMRQILRQIFVFDHGREGQDDQEAAGALVTLFYVRALVGTNH